MRPASSRSAGLLGIHESLICSQSDAPQRSASGAVGSMTGAAVAAQLGSEFNDFLYAPIGEERSGMTLSVLSALARQDVDPWERAAQLNRLPEEVAIRELAALLAALPDEVSAGSAPAALASRLIALLPQRSAAHKPGKSPPPLRVGKHVVPLGRVAIIVGYLLFILFSQWLIAGIMTPARTEKASAGSSSTALTHSVPPQRSR